MSDGRDVGIFSDLPGSVGDSAGGRSDPSTMWAADNDKAQIPQAVGEMGERGLDKQVLSKNSPVLVHR